MISKHDIVIGAFNFIRISGLTVSASPTEVTLGVSTLDDYAAELSPTLDTKYIQPSEYGQSDPADYSGLTPAMAGPMKKLLALQLAPFFGKEIPAMLYKIASDGMRSLERQLVSVGDAQNPSTLPIGSGNEQSYLNNKFYSEPNNDEGAENHYMDDVFNLTIDWSVFLLGEYDLVSVDYSADSGISLSGEEVNEAISDVTVAFNKTGQFQVCVKATNSNGDVKNVKYIYNSISCKRIDTIYP